MKDKITVRVEIDPACRTPEVVIRADQKTGLIGRIVAAVEKCGKSEAPRITVFSGGAALLLSQRDIFRVYTEARRLIVCTERESCEARCSLQELEKMLDPAYFVRISRFEIINIGKVSGFDVSVSGTIKVFFEDGSSTWVSRRQVRAIEERLTQL